MCQLNTTLLRIRLCKNFRLGKVNKKLIAPFRDRNKFQKRKIRILMMNPKGSTFLLDKASSQKYLGLQPKNKFPQDKLRCR